MPCNSPPESPADIKSWRNSASLPSASTSEEGPNLLTLDRRASNHRQAEQLTLEHA
jgi:hypothetical protein